MQWVTVVSSACPLSRDAHTCPLEKPLTGNSVSIIRKSGKKPQQILKFRPTLKKKFLPTFYLFWFFFSSFYSPDPLHPNPPITSSSAIPGEGKGRTGSQGVDMSLSWLRGRRKGWWPKLQEGLVAERLLPGRSLRCALASPSPGASSAAPPRRDPAGHCVVAALGLT